jgi:predicted nucleic-acid-binding protein
MKKAWLDANVILRFLLQDDQDLGSQAAAFMQAAEHEKLRLLLSPLVVAEVVWTLDSFYRVPKATIKETLEAFVLSEGIETEEKDVILASLSDFAEQNVDFIDAYVARHALAKGVPSVCTFDWKHFRRLPVTLVDCTADD